MGGQTLVVLWDLDGIIQDSEGLAQEGARHGFRTILGREPTNAELAQLVGRPVPVVYKEWFGDPLAQRVLDVGTQFYEERAHKIPAYLGNSRGTQTPTGLPRIGTGVIEAAYPCRA